MSPVAPTPGYRHRLAEASVASALRAVGAVVVEGPRACGKTWTARQFAASEVLFDGSDEQRLAFAVDPARILDGPAPRLLDEWHLVPGTWNAMRRACDDRPDKGIFLLTGSALPPDDITRHSGAGRVRRVRMRTMTLAESGKSTGEVSLGSLLEGEPVSAAKPAATFEDVVECAVRGGWPGLVDLPAATAQENLSAYLEEIARTDIARVDRVSRHPAGVSALIRSLARNVSSEASYAALADDADLDRASVKAYLEALERLFVVERAPAWQPRLMSRVPLRQAPKRFFVDPSLAAAAIEAGTDRLRGELNYFGLIFENLVMRDLLVYAGDSGCSMHHYRDKSGLEADAIVQRRSDGAWMAIEVKLGGSQAIDRAAAALLRLEANVDVSRIGPPARLLVITSTGYGYERPDGVAVAPITALGP